MTGRRGLGEKSTRRKDGVSIKKEKRKKGGGGTEPRSGTERKKSARSNDVKGPPQEQMWQPRQQGKPPKGIQTTTGRHPKNINITKWDHVNEGQQGAKA